MRAPDSALPGKLTDEVEGLDGRATTLRLHHLLGPHSPLRPSEASKKRHQLDARWFDERLGFTIGSAKRNRREGVREAYRRAYRAVIEETDAVVGELVKALGRIREETVIRSDLGPRGAPRGARRRRSR